MFKTKLQGVSISGVVCAVPGKARQVSEYGAYFSEKAVRKTTNMLGTDRLFRVSENQTTSDLCVAAAEKVLAKLNWAPDEVEGLVFVSQTPDYILPATSAVIHARLGLSERCLTIDILQGCSGYVQGMFIASQWISTGICKKVLLLVGDTISKLLSPQDRSVALLFGDAGSATALESNSTATTMSFVVGNKSLGWNQLMVPAGGFRQQKNSETCILKAADDGNIRSDENLFMNGSEVFNFTLEVVPSAIEELLNFHEWIVEDVDYFILHQANKFMLEYIANKVGLDKNKVPINIHKYGNTSSASIPLVIADTLGAQWNLKLCLIGFGVGFSWAAVALESDILIQTEIIEV